MAKRTKKTHPERAVLKGSGGEYVVTKVQMLFETTKLLAKKFRKSCVRGHNRKKESYLRNMILPTKGMRLEGSLERSTQAIKNQQIYARINLIFSKKVSKSHFSAQNEVYIFNKQSFITNETSLKMKGEVSSKYHKLGRSIMISCLHRKKCFMK